MFIGELPEDGFYISNGLRDIQKTMCSGSHRPSASAAGLKLKHPIWIHRSSVQYQSWIYLDNYSYLFELVVFRLFFNLCSLIRLVYKQNKNKSTSNRHNAATVFYKSSIVLFWSIYKNIINICSIYILGWTVNRGKLDKLWARHSNETTIAFSSMYYLRPSYHQDAIFHTPPIIQ